MTQAERNPVLEYDVLVCGGGCAGVAAALAAARSGAKTLVIERAPFAGGIMTAVGLPYFDGIAETKENRIVVRGIGLEIYQAMGGCEPGATHVHKHNPTIDNVERLKIVLDRLIASEANLDVLYDTRACDVRMSGDRIDQVLVANKAGLTPVRARVVIDASGDADVAAWSGAPTEKSAELQPMTLHFRIGNVRYHPDIRKLAREAVIKAHDRGELANFYGPGFGPAFASDEAYVHAVRVPADGTDPRDLTRAEIQGRIDAWTMFEVWKREVPGFEDAYFISSGPYIGVRETRRIAGRYVITEDDIVSGRSFDDAVATGCWYLDLHPNHPTVGSANKGQKVQPDPYDIPYGTLLPQRVENLLVAGRCHSATRMAASSTRVNVTAMALGQAAGVAAAWAAEARVSPQELDGREIRRRLVEAGGGPDKDYRA